MQRRTVLSIAVAAAVAAFTLPAQAQWKPSKPITVIVPWAAGGSTDQVVRVTAAELEKALGQKVIVVNQPGASGSVGTKNAFDAPRDGYTWASGAAKDIGSYQTLGMLDTKIQDWSLYLNVAHIAVVSVNPATPYKTIADLLGAFKAKPGQISVATAGLASSGHAAIEAIAQKTGITYRHVTYNGGNPAVVATVAGETEVTPQLAAEQAQMLRGGKLRALAVVGDRALTIDGVGTIQPLSQTVPGFTDPVNYFGIFVPKNVPAEVTATLDKIWAEQISKSETLRKYAQDQGALFLPAHGDAAHKAAFPAIQKAAWQAFNGGKAKVSPDTVGIPKP